MSTLQENTQNFIRDQVDGRIHEAGDAAGEHVKNLHTMGESLRTQGQDTTARYVDMAADRLNDIANYLRSAHVERMTHDLENMARKQPLISATIGFAGGFMAARLLKAAAEQRYADYGGNYGGNYGGDYGSEY